MVKTIAIALALVSLTGCSALAPVVGTLLGSGGPSVGVDARIAEEANQQVVVGDQNKTEIDAEKVSYVRQENNQKEVGAVKGPVQDMVINNMMAVPAWVWLLCLIGWMLPSPSEIGRGLAAPFKWMLGRK